MGVRAAGWALPVVGVGGTGSLPTVSFCGAGGGGAGYYGGSGGGVGNCASQAGGGGGSSYLNLALASVATSATFPAVSVVAGASGPRSMPWRS